MLFPMICNQKMNAYLKEIARFRGIKKNMAHRVARHIFATTVTISNGVHVETVSKMLEHSKLATKQIHAHVLKKKITRIWRPLEEAGLTSNAARFSVAAAVEVGTTIKLQSTSKILWFKKSSILYYKEG